MLSSEVGEDVCPSRPLSLADLGHSYGVFGPVVFSHVCKDTNPTNTGFSALDRPV
jgi:hypothetical protein